MFLPFIITFAHFFAKYIAVVLPSHLLDPVTSTTFSFRNVCDMAYEDLMLKLSDVVDGS